MTKVASMSRGTPPLSDEQALVGTEEGYQVLIQRAWDLVPLVASRAAEAEKLGKTPSDVIEAMNRTGLLKMLRPARFGGYAQRPELLFDVGAIIARGCMSTAWVLINLAMHDLYVANWPVQAQEEVWSGDPAILIGSTFVFPAGRARPVEGGYVLSGRWPFSSGVHPCQWNILGGIVQPSAEGEAPHQRYFLLRRDQYEILDTWHVEALRGTGSADVEAKEVFVPDHLTLDYVELLEGRTAGGAIHNDPMISFPFAAAGGFMLLCAVYGAVRGALDEFVEKARGAVARSSGKALAAEPTYQSKVSEASAMVDMVELAMRSAFRSMQDDVAAGVRFTGKNALKLRRDSSFCARLCVQAADILFALGGGSALYQRNPLQRMWRDVHGGSAHIVFQWDIHGVAFGRVELGLPSGLPGMQV